MIQQCPVALPVIPTLSVFIYVLIGYAKHWYLSAFLCINKATFESGGQVVEFNAKLLINRTVNLKYLS